MATLNFNAENVEPNTGFDPIPAGRYNLMVEDTDMCETKAGNGHYLKITFKVIEGEYVNRFIWLNLNLDNPNPKAVEIAQRELSGLCRACGKMSIEDSEELHGEIVSGQVKIKPGTDGYSPSNTVGAFKEPVTSGESVAPWE
jgi:hypothetical protein